MPLIKDGREIEDVWSFIPDEAELAPGGCMTVTIGRLLSQTDLLLARNTAIGVRLRPEDDPTLLEPYLDRLALIEIDFPRYTDGRGYSQAQLLRRRFGYEGELRAVGHVLRDQLLYMHRSGLNAFSTRRADLNSLLEAVAEISSHYQPAADGVRHVFTARHATRRED